MNATTDNAKRLQRFEADGFVALGQFVTGQELTTLIANVDRLIRDVVPDMPPDHVFYEDKNDPATLKQIQQMGDHDPWFHELFTNSRVREVAELLLDGPVVPKNMQYLPGHRLSRQPAARRSAPRPNRLNAPRSRSKRRLK
jgi:phytanoyl-CoA hydroxylase